MTSNVDVTRVLRTVPEELGGEVTDVEPEDGALPHRDISAGRRIEKAVVEQRHFSPLKQPPPEVGVLAVEID